MKKEVSQEFERVKHVSFIRAGKLHLKIISFAIKYIEDNPMNK